MIIYPSWVYITPEPSLAESLLPNIGLLDLVTTLIPTTDGPHFSAIAGTNSSVSSVVFICVIGVVTEVADVFGWVLSWFALSKAYPPPAVNIEHKRAEHKPTATSEPKE